MMISCPFYYVLLFWQKKQREVLAPIICRPSKADHKKPV